MDPNPRKLQHRTLEDTQNEHEQASQQAHAVREFAEVDDLLRHDAAQTPLPPALEERLRNSIDAVEPRQAPWWRRLFRT